MNQWRKGVAHWKCGDTLYISVVFTWDLGGAYWLSQKHNGPVKMGGPAIGEPTECDGFEPLLYHNPSATFTSRGCPNDCGFCIVNKIEPIFKEIENYRPAPMICDNNFLASSINHVSRVIEDVKRYKKVDFQGIDADYLTPEKADLLGKTKCIARLGWDNRDEVKVHDAVRLLQERSTKDICVYVIIGYLDSPDDARRKLETVRSWGALPFAMRYQPIDNPEKNSYVAGGWTNRELKKMSRYYNRLNWLGHIPYEDYQYTEQAKMEWPEGER